MLYSKIWIKGISVTFEHSHSSWWPRSLPDGSGSPDLLFLTLGPRSRYRPPQRSQPPYRRRAWRCRSTACPSRGSSKNTPAGGSALMKDGARGESPGTYKLSIDTGAWCCETRRRHARREGIFHGWFLPEISSSSRNEAEFSWELPCLKKAQLYKL